MNDLIERGDTMLWLIVIAVFMWVLQLVLSILQFRRFAAHVKGMRREGRVTIGKAKGRFVAGAIVLFVIDGECRILRGEIMKGVTVFAGFRPFNDFNGSNLLDLDEESTAGYDRQTRRAILGAREEYIIYQEQGETLASHA